MAKSGTKEASKKSSPKKPAPSRVVEKKTKKEKKVAEAAGSSATAATKGGTKKRKIIPKEGLCTNSFCLKTWDKTWRKGPLGPRTLCNACGLQYIKLVRSRGSGITQPQASPDQKE